MKFRRKRRKGERISDPVHIDVDEGSDDDFDGPELEAARFYGPAPPLTPPELPEALRRQEDKYTRKTRDLLKLTLHHGDTLIQQGPELQKLYEV
jgi:hypothetical protein